MQRDQAARLSALYRIGELVAEPQVVTGGQLHRMWRLTTTRGAFAVKQLNSAIMQKPGIQHEYLVSEHIARTMALHGIPAIAALKNEKGLLQEIDGMFLLVYPWVDGEVTSSSPVDAARAADRGAPGAHAYACIGYTRSRTPRMEAFSQR
ncbi:MAG: hypothetical protein NVSMB44_14720 [Ktedonobacteraceae bacterium]